jgi:hypothetical protein
MKKNIKPGMQYDIDPQSTSIEQRDVIELSDELLDQVGGAGIGDFLQRLFGFRFKDPNEFARERVGRLN